MKIKLLLSLLFASVMSYSQCTNIPANSSSSTVTYTFSGGSFQSYGCAPIDPTYWMAGSSCSVIATFTTPQNYPKFRVWGMNTDDVASVLVNGVSYPLNASTASYDPKVVCGISPGPDGVIFSNGNFMGANTPVAGNYSYSDIQLNTTNVTSIRVNGLSGAGWGFASTLILCPLANAEYDWNANVSLYTSSNKLFIEVSQDLIGTPVMIYDLLGKEIKKFTLDEVTTIQNMDKGIFLLKMEKENTVFAKKIMVN